MSIEEMITQSLIASAPSNLVIIVAAFYVAKAKGSFYKLFILGLFIMFIPSIVSLPLVQWLWANHPEIMRPESPYVSLPVAGMDVIYAVGLSFCAYSFYRRAGNA